MPAINIMHTTAGQFTKMKKSELLEFVERKKSHIIAICEVNLRSQVNEQNYTMQFLTTLHIQFILIRI